MNSIVGSHVPAALSAAAPRDGYRPELDGLRAVAVLAVLLFHAFPQIGGHGFAGVDAFFVLSGYLIGGVLLRDPDLSLTSFYAHRVRRIFPALSLTILGTLAAGWVLLATDEYRALGWHALAGAAFLPNFALMAEMGYFDVAAHWKPLLHLWSLGVEEQFYLLFPLLLAACRRRATPFAISLAITTGSLIWVALIVTVFPIESQPSTLFFSPFCRFWELGLGAMLVSAKGAEDFRRIRSMVIFGLASLMVWSITSRPVPGSIATAWAIAGAVMAASWYISSTESPLHRFLSLPTPVYLGRISYPLYLWHWPILVLGEVITASFDVRPAPWLIGAVAIPVSIGLASATYHLLECRVRYHPSRAIVPALLVAMLAAGLLGGLITLQEGVPDRPAARADFVEQTRWDWWDEKRCASHLNLDAPCQVSGDRPTTLLLGDSHANDLFPGLVEHAGGGIAHVSTEFRSAVRPYVQSFLKADSGIRTVVIAQFWENRGWDSAALEDVIHRSLSAGQQVILVLDTPNIGIPGLVRLTTYCKGRECTIGRHELLTRQTVFRDVSARLKEKYPALIVFDPLDALCEGDTCWIERNGELRLRDDNHLSRLGSRMVGALLKF